MVCTQKKISPNVVKLSTLFYQKPSNKDNILFRLPNSTINNHKIKGGEIKKNFGALLKGNLLWKNHLNPLTASVPII